jgi:ubiquinol-cytochrome c reductase iron-sulfur subunit
MQKVAEHATDTATHDPDRRDFLYIWTGALGAFAAGTAVVPLVSQMQPDASTVAAGAPIDVDLSQIPEGQVITVKWRGKPIFVRNRTAKEIEESKAVQVASLPDPQSDADRIRSFDGKPQEKWIVTIGICTHLGCVPLNNQGEFHGWYCPCHGSHYDNAGRIRKGPAPKNLELPQYAFTSATKVRIG